MKKLGFGILAIAIEVGTGIPNPLNATAAGTVPDPGLTPAISISSTLNTAPPNGFAVKQFIVGFRNTTTDPDSYIGDLDLKLEGGANQVIVDINGEVSLEPFILDRTLLGYSIRLDYPDADSPQPEVGDVVTFKFVAGAFDMPDPNTGWEPFVRFDRISTTGGNSILQGPDEGTVAALPDSPDVPQAPTATAGVEQATVEINPNSGGETVNTYRVTASPGGESCDITPPDTSCMVSGLQAGTSYTFTAVALNAGLPSAASSASNSVTPTSPAARSRGDGASGTSRVPDSHPGIFLTVRGDSGSNATGSEVRYGAYAIRSNSPFLLSLRVGTDLSTQRVLASGQTRLGGHLDHTITLPRLSPGSHVVVLTAIGPDGQALTLGNRVIVSNDGTIASITEEALQPSVR